MPIVPAQYQAGAPPPVPNLHSDSIAAGHPSPDDLPRAIRGEARIRPSGPGELETSLGNSIRDELIQLGGLFPWDAKDVAVARALGEGSEPEAALRRLVSRAPRLAKLVGDGIDDYRSSIQGAYDELREHNGHDAVYKQVLETVAGEFSRLMPVLMLSPGGPYQQILEMMISQLEPQDGDGALSQADQIVLARGKQQVEALKRLADNGPDRLQRVTRIIEQYDERIIPAQATHHDTDGRTLN